MGWLSKKTAAVDEVDPSLQDYFSKATKGDETTSFQGKQDEAREALVVPEVTHRSTLKSLRQIAMDNCVEYERVYSQCLVRGTLFDRFASCPTQKAMHDKCCELQRNALKVMHYGQATTDAEMLRIKGQADDFMIKHIPGLNITEGMVERFEKELESLEKSA